MPGFFPTPSNVNFKNAGLLASYTGTPVVFNAKDKAHTDLITGCADELKKRLLALQEIDKKALIGFALGTAAFGLSYILPISIVAIAGFAYGAYQLGLRTRAYMDYAEALENLVGCCQWTLGRVTDKSIINNETIQGMMTTLAPLTNEQQLRDFIDNKHEDQLVKKADEVRGKTIVMGYPLDQEEASLYYKIYGYGQGGVLAILQGIGYVISNAFKAAKQALTKTPATDEASVVEGATPAVGSLV